MTDLTRRAANVFTQTCGLQQGDHLALILPRVPDRKLLQVKASDVFWCLSDPGWILALVGSLIEPWTAGSTVFVHHLPQFDPNVIVQTLFKYPITQCLAAPSVFRMILQQNLT
ncbi:hypothetical protein HPG69_005071, partial [Diceros bicornis minor]